MQGETDFPLKCIVCNKGFQKNSKLIIHMRSHTGEKPYVCSECGRGFTIISALNRHMRIHTGEKPFVCHICNQAFLESCTLKRHILRHKGEKNYMCTICNKGYTTNTDLAGHMRRHRTENTQVCEVCSKSFLFKADLKRHMSDVHLKIKPLSCGICEKPFAHKYRLMIHQKTHFKDKNAVLEKPYGCPTCDKTFAERRLLVQHIKYHLPRQFSCTDCGKGFITRSKLNCHVKKIHMKDKVVSETEKESPTDNQIFIKDELNCGVKLEPQEMKKELDSNSEGFQEPINIGTFVKVEMNSDSDSCEDSADIGYDFSNVSTDVLDYPGSSKEVKPEPLSDEERSLSSEITVKPGTSCTSVPDNSV